MPCTALVAPRACRSHPRTGSAAPAETARAGRRPAAPSPLPAPPWAPARAAPPWRRAPGCEAGRQALRRSPLQRLPPQLPRGATLLGRRAASARYAVRGLVLRGAISITSARCAVRGFLLRAAVEHYTIFGDRGDPYMQNDTTAKTRDGTLYPSSLARGVQKTHVVAATSPNIGRPPKIKFYVSLR